MLDILGTVLTGGATGVIGSIIGKAFGFIENWQKEKFAKNEHERTMDMHKLQHEIRAAELEQERDIVLEEAAANLREASYRHDQSIGKSSIWVNNILRLVRPVLTAMLIGLVGWFYIDGDGDDADKSTIVNSIIYMASSAVLWWFGDRAMSPKK